MQDMTGIEHPATHPHKTPFFSFFNDTRERVRSRCSKKYTALARVYIYRYIYIYIFIYLYMCLWIYGPEVLPQGPLQKTRKAHVRASRADPGVTVETGRRGEEVK